MLRFQQFSRRPPFARFAYQKNIPSRFRFQLLLIQPTNEALPFIYRMEKSIDIIGNKKPVRE